MSDKDQVLALAAMSEEDEAATMAAAKKLDGQRVILIPWVSGPLDPALIDLSLKQAATLAGMTPAERTAALAAMSPEERAAARKTRNSLMQASGMEDTPVKWHHVHAEPTDSVEWVVTLLAEHSSWLLTGMPRT